MSLVSSTGAHAPTPSPIQFVNIELTPIVGGRFSVAMQATFVDEEKLEFIGQDLANAHVATLDEALAIIRQNVAALATQA